MQALAYLVAAQHQRARARGRGSAPEREPSVDLPVPCRPPIATTRRRAGSHVTQVRRSGRIATARLPRRCASHGRVPSLVATDKAAEPRINPASPRARDIAVENPVGGSAATPLVEVHQQKSEIIAKIDGGHAPRRTPAHRMERACPARGTDCRDEGRHGHAARSRRAHVRCCHAESESSAVDTARSASSATDGVGQARVPCGARVARGRRRASTGRHPRRRLGNAHGMPPRCRRGRRASGVRATRSRPWRQGNHPPVRAPCAAPSRSASVLGAARSLNPNRPSACRTTATTSR